jgi:hypothetical protein
MKKLFLTASALFSAIPGIAIIISGLGAPTDYKVLFGGVIEAFGTLSLLILSLNRTSILSMTLKKVTKIAIWLGVFSFISLSVYVVLFSYSVVTVTGRGSVYYPIYTSGRIAEMINRAGSRPAAIQRYGIAAVSEAIDEMPGTPLALTTILLLFIYQSVFTSLALAFGFLGIRHREDFNAENQAVS